MDIVGTVADEPRVMPTGGGADVARRLSTTVNASWRAGHYGTKAAVTAHHSVGAREQACRRCGVLYK